MAGVRISYKDATLGNFYARVYRWSSTAGTGLTHLWDDAAGEWDTIDNVASADAKIDLAEQFYGDYFAHTVNLDEYTGWISVTIHDDDGANDPLQLAMLERRFQRRQAEALMREGVRLADPARLDVRGTVSVGTAQNIARGTACRNPDGSWTPLT